MSGIDSSLMRATIGGAATVLLLCAGLAAGEEKRIDPPSGKEPGGSQGRGVLVDGVLHVPGQGGEDANGKIPGAFEAEVKQALDNVGVVLKEAGMSPADVVTVQVYVTDGALLPRMNVVYTRYFQAPRPIRTAVVAARLERPGNIEITATAKK